VFGDIDRKKSTKAYFLCKDHGFFGCKSSSGQSYVKLNALAGLGGLINLSKGAMRRVGSNGECFESSESQWPVHAALLVAQLLSGGYYVIIKMALVNEMNLIVLSVYRDLLALVFLIPAAWLIERQNFFRLSRDVVLWLLVLGLIGIFGSQFLLFKGISLTSTEVSVAMHPLIPVFTAVVAIVFG
jgi:drug/metabolite transporter (DMT)-like permease